MKTMKTLGAATAFGVLALPAFASEEVKIGVQSWPGAQAIAHVLGEIVTSRIGGKVEYVPGNNAAIFQAMDQGKGDIDVHSDVWLPNQQSFVDEFVTGKGTVTLSSNPYEGNQGLCVSQDFATRLNVTDITDLGRPEVAAAMDSDGNGKGEMWIGAPGWASANANEVKVRDYGLLDFIEPIRAEEAVMTARIKDSIAKGEGFAFYCYEPHAIWFMFDVVMLTEPPYDPAKYIMVQPADDPDWYAKSTVATKDDIKNVQIAWSTSLADRSPTIAEFFSNFSLTAEDVSKLAYEMTANGRPPEEAAKEWVEANSDRVDAMLGL
jgi:glycine betaine/proline transport system substrate-binding protein